MPPPVSAQEPAVPAEDLTVSPEGMTQAETLLATVSFAHIKAWRDQEYQAGRPCGLLDFYRSHGLCIVCQASGSKALPIHWEGEEPIFEPCEACQGAGRIKTSLS